MKYKKSGPWAKAVAKTTGLYQENGVLLIKGKFTKKEVDEFNGKASGASGKKSTSKKKVDEKHSYSNRSSKEDLEESHRLIRYRLHDFYYHPRSSLTCTLVFR